MTQPLNHQCKQNPEKQSHYGSMHSQRRAVTKLQNLWFNPFAMYIYIYMYVYTDVVFYFFSNKICLNYALCQLSQDSREKTTKSSMNQVSSQF